MDSKWTENGQKIDQNWTKNKQKTELELRKVIE